MARTGSQIRFRFGRDDLLRTRFAIAPSIEITAATYVLRMPGRFPEHRRFIESALPRLAGLDHDLLYAVNPLGRRAWPNFNAPSPVSPHPRIADELARVASTAPRIVVEDVRRAYPEGVPSDMSPFLEDPKHALADLTTQMRGFWDAALAPWWPRIAEFLESEIAARARRLVTAGGAAAFTGLDRTVSWDGEVLTVSPAPWRRATSTLPVGDCCSFPRRSRSTYGRASMPHGIPRSPIGRPAWVTCGSGIQLRAARWRTSSAGAALRSFAPWSNRLPPAQSRNEPAGVPAV